MQLGWFLAFQMVICTCESLLIIISFFFKNGHPSISAAIQPGTCQAGTCLARWEPVARHSQDEKRRPCEYEGGGSNFGVENAALG